MNHPEDDRTTCHALRNLDRNQDPWNAPMIVCEDTGVIQALQQDLPMPPGHDITTTPSQVNCPECLRRRRVMAYSGAGWAPLRPPPVGQETSEELNAWARWAAGFIDSITERAQQLQQQPGCPHAPAGTEALSSAAASLREWSSLDPSPDRDAPHQDTERRIQELHQTAGEQGCSISRKSLRDLREFLPRRPPSTQPELHLTPEGMLRATWADRGNRTSLTFHGNGVITWVTHSATPGRTGSAAGILPLARVNPATPALPPVMSPP